MLFNTPSFAIILPFIILLFYVVPNRLRKYVLLIFDYAFILSLGGWETVIVVSFVIITAYLTGIMVSRVRNKKVVAASFVMCMLVLLFYNKYFNYFAALLNTYSNFKLQNTNYVTVIGVSYYVFSSISYIVDIIRGKDETDRNILDFALWISFFAKFIAGPIEKHNRFKQQMIKLNSSKFCFENVKRGLLVCSLGYFYKMVLADRIATFVNSVYTNLDSNYGIILFITMILYSLQIYFDFAGYSMIAYGIAYALDIRMIQNFNHPYFASGMRDFWNKWHISLSEWLKEYIYIPLGGNRKGKVRQYINIFITFIVSGIWHGAGLHYIAWGGLHGLFQILERITNASERISKRIRVIITYFLVSFAWIFFRADSLRCALEYVHHMITLDCILIKDNALLNNGLDVKGWFALLLFIIVAFVIEYCQVKGISLYTVLQRRNIVFRWAIYYIIIVILLVFGKYGLSYNSSDFIYFKY